ncbi:type II toxin-antitoxin system RelE/ParE family toxin [Pragia fontium]|uniref:type II toxin-antitoxin system RelE/ParE family toxin n=1 Tax=Pragia fontium TaxID=82985 RepID=UPI00064A5F63|nr:type II toxin-antitoxin system RelE/ParE family toxin [Pragia fontium]AKJ41879.1 hypothetical protein QQ39_07085 [Pragia fontium]
MLKSKEVRLTPKAISDLENIYRYSHREFGQIKAERYIRCIDAALNKLADFPQLGIHYFHLAKDLMGYKVESHIVFYRVRHDVISVLRVLHKSMDYAEYIPG